MIEHTDAEVIDGVASPMVDADLAALSTAPHVSTGALPDVDRISDAIAQVPRGPMNR